MTSFFQGQNAPSTVLEQAMALAAALAPSSGEGPPADTFGLVGTFYTDIADPDNPIQYGPKQVSGWGTGRALVGPPGPKAEAAYLNLTALKAAVPDVTAAYSLTTTSGPIPYAYCPGDFTGRADDVNVVKLDAVSLTTGALVRQTTSALTYQAQGGIPRDLTTKQAEVEVSIADYGNGNAVTATNSALAVLGTSASARLVFPKGAWTIGAAVDWSAYRNITFVFRAGAIIDQGTNSVILPERVDMQPGARFAGTGSVIIRNKDEQPLATPPGGYVRTGNDARGLRAAVSLTKGVNNLAWGTDALASATSARSNIAIGTEALKSLTGSTDASSAYGTFMGIADGNCAIGDSVLRDCTTGYENVGVGMFNMQRMKTGRWNIAVGVQNLILNTAGSCNVAIGPYAGVTYPGNNSVMVGFSVMENHDGGGSNTGIGYVALAGSRSTSRTTAVGSQCFEKLEDGTACAGVGDRAMATAKHADGCTVMGVDALSSMVDDTNANNTAIGRNALLALTVGSGNTAVGAGAMNASGNVVNSTAIGLSAQVTGNNQLQLGGVGTTTYAYGAVQDRSDRRDKADIRDTVLGLDFIKALRPVDFRWDMRDDYRPPAPERTAGEPPVRGEDTTEYDAAVEADRLAMGEWQERNPLSAMKPNGSMKRVRFHHGVIAQDVQSLIDNGVIEDFGGLQHHEVNGGDDVYSIGYEELIAPLIKAVQQLSALADQQQATIGDLIARLAKLETAK